MTRLLESYVQGRWQTSDDEGKPLFDASTGDVVAHISSTGLDTAGILDHAHHVGGPALRELTFHDRADLLKTLAKYLHESREQIYPISARAGATRRDSRVDIDGGIGTALVFASKGRKELPNSTVYAEDEAEPLGKTGAFAGQHLLTSRLGALLQINAFNFPVWGMLEKFAPAFLAGLPCIVKPASSTAYVTEQFVRTILDAQVLPEGTLQLICGSTGNLLYRLTGQDAVA